MHEQLPPPRPRIRTVLRLLWPAYVALGFALMLPIVAVAGLPSAYAPIVIEPAGAPARYEFDLTAALARVRREHRRLYVYLGASDCPYCRKYEAFLDGNAKALAPEFAAHYIVVDLRSALSVTANLLYIRIGDRTLPYADFQRAIGDERARMLVYPSVWLLDQDALPLMQMPAGTGTFQTVAEQLEILRLEQ